MNQYLRTFKDYSNEYLLERRALGDEIDDEAHAAIEEILAERGVPIPPRPLAPIHRREVQRRTPLLRQWSFWALLVVAIFATAAGKVLAHTWIGYVSTVAFLGYYLVRYFRRSGMSEGELQAEDDKKRAGEEGVTDIMLMAAEGNLQRIRELVSYGADVNERSELGSTALMYAARNGHKSVVEYLLSVGADKAIATDKGSTARSIAERSGHAEVARLL